MNVSADRYGASIAVRVPVDVLLVEKRLGSHSP